MTRPRKFALLYEWTSPVRAVRPENCLAPTIEFLTMSATGQKARAEVVIVLSITSRIVQSTREFGNLAPFVRAQELGWHTGRPF
jgi:hypothetical protein